MTIEQIASVFCMEGTPVRYREFGHGHINSTYRIETDAGKKYVLQKINQYVFKDPASVMSNASRITSHIRDRVDDPRMALHFLETRDGEFYYVDSEGEYWRMYDFVGGFCLDAPEEEADFYQSALAFGRFQQQLADFPAENLVETIPEFHNTIDRYAKLREAIEADPLGRLAGVQEDVRFLLDREERGTQLQRMRESHQLPLRVTHNDTKLNNVLLDKKTRQSLCVLDLDTVMPGLSAYDFGDSIRFGAATAAEDEQDLSKMSLDLHLFEVYTRGFLEAATALTEQEIEMLPMGAYVMALEVATRFLKDYLEGDKYFRIDYPEHNLVRARSQMKLVWDMESKMDAMQQIVRRIAQEQKK